jgi:molecular chaperone DnaK (HSP70)
MRLTLGIDLGTTHCSVAIADASGVRTLPLLQLVAKGTMGTESLLPSFVYLAHESDGVQSLPWAEVRTFAVGEYARSRASDASERVVVSAKSWLCHEGVDRRSAILPRRTGGAEDDAAFVRISPVEASFRYLEHIVEALRVSSEIDATAADIVLTVPASFDAAARELTVEAALAAGLRELTLLEEPQAAVYAWLAHQGDAWRKALRVGDRLLVVDVGGGTTDFSMILVSEQAGSLALERIAVGDHILLGGDNMDLFLAHLCQEKLDTDLDAALFAQLTFVCRSAKEKLLAEQAPDSVPIAVAKRGSKLVGSTLRTELSQADLKRVLLEGFFPEVAPRTLPVQTARSGLRSLGLPYAQDAAITRHLSGFLSRQELPPTAVLFNGGVMKSAALRARVMAHVAAWSPAQSPPRELDFADYDLAVAKGAAAYGLARNGTGVRIRAGAARAYYVGVEPNGPVIPGVSVKPDLLCIASFGMEEGTAVDVVDESLGLVVGEPVSFRFFGSAARPQDRVGARFSQRRVKDDSEVIELAPIRTILPAEGRTVGALVPVRLRVEFTEIGTLKLFAVPESARSEGERWELELSVREN